MTYRRTCSGRRPRLPSRIRSRSRVQPSVPVDYPGHREGCRHAGEGRQAAPLWRRRDPDSRRLAPVQGDSRVARRPCRSRHSRGKGTFPEDHPLSVGPIGMHGRAEANKLVGECDVLLAVGVRFSDRSTGNFSEFAPDAKIIHIDADPTEFNKNKLVTLHTRGHEPRAQHALRRACEAHVEEDRGRHVAAGAPEPDPGRDEGYPRLQGLLRGVVGTQDRQADEGYPAPGGDPHDRCRQAPDVVRDSLPRHAAEDMGYVHRSGDHGLRVARGHRREVRHAQRPGRGLRRRRGAS